MRITNILILLFLLSAFSIGVALKDSNVSLIDSSINNASLVIKNLTLDKSIDSQIPNMKGFYEIIEQGVKFVGVLAIEVMRTGIYFGHDNPSYFSPEFIFKIMKLIVWLVVISLLIKPLLYLIIFLIMIGIYVKDYYKSKDKNNYAKMKLTKQKLKEEIKEGLVVGLVYSLVVGLVYSLVVGLVYSLVAGLVAGLVYGLVYRLVCVKNVEKHNHKRKTQPQKERKR